MPVSSTAKLEMNSAETFVEFSYFAGAGHGIVTFVLDDSGSTLTGDISLVDDVGGVIVETIHGK